MIVSTRTLGIAGGLLPTIRSRVQTIVVNRPDHSALSQQFRGVDPKLYDRAYAMSGGVAVISAHVERTKSAA